MVDTTSTLPEKRKIDVRNMTLFGFGKLITLFGTSAYTFSMSLYILDKTGSALGYSGSLIFGTLPQIIISPFAGVLVGKVDKKKFSILLNFLSATVVLSTLLFLKAFGFSYITIYVSEFLLSSLNAVNGVNNMSFVPEIVSKRYIQKIMSLNSFSGASSSVLGPILAGVAYPIFSIEGLMSFNAISFIIYVACIMLIKFQPISKKDKLENKEENYFEGIVEGWKTLRNIPQLFTMTKIAIIQNFFLCCLSVCFPFMILTVLKYSSSQYGFMEGLFAIGMLLSSLVLIGAKNLKKPTLFYFSNSLVVSVLIGLLGVSTLFLSKGHALFYILTILMFVMGIASNFNDITFQTTMQLLTPKDSLGTVVGIYGSVSLSVTPIAFLIYGFLQSQLDAYAIFIGSGILGVISVILLSVSGQMSKKAIEITF